MISLLGFLRELGAKLGIITERELGHLAKGEGKTPVEMASVKLEGEDKWITLIQNARQMNKENNGSS